MITRKFMSDFTNLSSKLFDITIIAPNGDRVTYTLLTGDQAEQLWRMWQVAEACGWRLAWIGSRDREPNPT